MDQGQRRSRDWPWLAAILVLAVGVRLLPAPFVVMSDRIAFFGHDAWYHMRRIAYTLVNFPAALDFDPYINFPEGARAIWTPVLDWTIAALIWPFHEGLSPWTVGLLASLVPPLLGVLTILALYRLARRHLGPRVALLAAAVLSVLPGHFWYSQIGFVDHHCAVALVATLLLGAGMAFFDAVAQRRSGWAGAVGLGVLLGTALVVWPGMLLHVGIVEIGLMALLLGRVDAQDAAEVASRLALVHLTAFAVVAPLSLGSAWSQWSALSPVVLSDFQPWLFGSATVLAAACAGAWRIWPPSGATRGARAASAFGLGVVTLLAGGLLFPALTMGGAEAWGWLARTDHFQGLVAESQPLFMARGEISLMAAAANLSIFLFAMPIALVAGVVAARRRAHPEALLLLLGWTFVVCLAAVMQRRFANSASVVVALALAVSVVALYDRLVGRGSAASARRMAAGALAALICGGALLPVWVIYAPFLHHYTSEHGRVVLRGDHYNRYAMMETAAWLGRHTPPTRGWLDASVQPEYAVLAPWVMGHVIEYVARRPTTTNNFGDDIGSRNFLSAQAYYGADEARASELLDRLDVRYVVVPFRVGFLAERPPPASMYHALFDHDGARFTPRGAAPGEPVPALERHRLIFEFSRTNRDEGRRPTYKVFEYVRGARLRGRSSPGAEIHAELSLETREGRSFVYAARATAAESGRFVLRVPYASGIEDGAVTSADQYVVRCESEPAEIRPPAREVFVDESDVVRGKVVRVPDPCANGA